jgi:hypothetical protein
MLSMWAVSMRARMSAAQDSETASLEDRVEIGTVASRERILRTQVGVWARPVHVNKAKPF